MGVTGRHEKKRDKRDKEKTHTHKLHTPNTPLPIHTFFSFFCLFSTRSNFNASGVRQLQTTQGTEPKCLNVSL